MSNALLLKLKEKNDILIVKKMRLKVKMLLIF